MDIIVVTTQVPSGIAERIVKYGRFKTALGRAKESLGALADLRQEFERRFGSEQGVTVTIGDTTCSAVQSLHVMFASLAVHKFKAREACHCQDCGPLLVGLETALGKEPFNRLANAMSQLNSLRVSSVGQVRQSLMVVGGPFTALGKSCKEVQALRPELEEVKKKFEAFSDDTRARRVLSKREFGQSGFWDVIFPADTLVKGLIADLSKLDEKVLAAVEARNRIDVTAPPPRQKFRKEEKSAGLPADLKMPPATAVEGPAGIPAETAAAQVEEAARQPAAPAPATADVSKPALPAAEAAANAAAAPEPAEQKLPEAPLELADETLESHSPGSGPAGENEAQFIYEALEGYVLDEELRARLAEKISKRDLLYRMAELERAFPPLDRDPDANLYDIQAVLNADPSLLTIPAPQFAEYVQTGVEIARLKTTREVPESAAECDPQACLSNFTGVGAIKGLLKRINEAVAYEKLCGALRGLEYDPEGVFAILRCGFFYHGSLHMGNHIIPEEGMIRENVARIKGRSFWSEQQLDETFRKFKRDRVITPPPGRTGFSINIAGMGEDGQRSKTFTEVIQWVIKHPNPRERYGFISDAPVVE